MDQTFGFVKVEDIMHITETELVTISKVDEIQSNLDEHIKQFYELSEMYIEYAYGNSQHVQQLEDNLIKYATALSRNLVAVRCMIDTLEQTDNDIQKEIDTKFANIGDSLDKISHMIEDLQVQTVKRDDYPGSDIKRKYNSIIRMGNIRIPIEKKFSKLAKWVWKKLLGVRIVDISKVDTIVIHKNAGLSYNELEKGGSHNEIDTHHIGPTC